MVDITDGVTCFWVYVVPVIHNTVLGVLEISRTGCVSQYHRMESGSLIPVKYHLDCTADSINSRNRNGPG